MRRKLGQGERARNCTDLQQGEGKVKKVAESWRDMIIPTPMDIDTIPMDRWTGEYTYDHDENHDPEEDDKVCLVE